MVCALRHNICIARVWVRSADCCPTPAASCAAGYAWGVDGSNQCPTSHYAIVNEAACEAAAAAAGKAYLGSETVPYLPSGCYIYQQDGGGFYLNADAVGAGVPGAQLLCSGATRTAGKRHHGLLWGTHWGTQVCRIGAQGGARRRSTWLDAQGLSDWARELLRSHARGALGTPPSAGVLIGYSRCAPLRACTVYRTRPKAIAMYGQRSQHHIRSPTCTHAACPP
jgi:hypothetical protein